MVADAHPPSSRPHAPPGAGADAGQADSVGAYLRRLRVAKGASLEDISRATRVGRRHLEALEGDESGELPAPVFVKGFIRAYCEFLETKPDDALARYRQHVGPPAAPQRFGGGGRGVPSRLGSPIAVSLLLLAVLSGALIAVNLGLRSGGPRSASRPAGSTPAASAPAPATAPAPGPATATQAAAPEAAPARPAVPAEPATGAAVPTTPATVAGGGRQRLVVRALESTWVRVQMDRATAVEELLPEGAVREWSAQQDFVLTVGNAGGLELTLNGQRLPPLGDRGAVIRELVLPQHATAPRS